MRNDRITFLFALVFVGISWQLTGQNINRPNIEAPMGLTVNAFTGNLYHGRSEVTLPGQGLSLDLAFHYNSQCRNDNRGYGFGWTFSYNIYYELQDDQSVIVHRTDGRRDSFAFQESQYIAPLGIFEELEAYQPGRFRLSTKSGMTYLFEEPSHGKITQITDRHGNALTFFYTNGDLTSVQDASGRQIELIWQQGYLHQITDANQQPGRSWTYTYNDGGQLTSVANPLDEKTYYYYGPANELLSIVDENGNEAVVIYSGLFSVREINTCVNRIRFSYSSASRQTFVIEDGDGVTRNQSYTFDDAGNLLQLTGNCCGYNVQYEYDERNNLIKVTDANGQVTIYTYDQRGNRLTEADPLGNTITYTYEPVFNQTASVTDQRGNTTTFSYDNNGNLSRIDRPEGITEYYTYDGAGNLTNVTDGNNQTTGLNYDNFGQLTSIDFPIGQRQFTYDELGNLLSATDGNQLTVSYSYDAINRLLDRVNPQNEQLALSYNGNDDLTQTTDANGHSVQYQYDPLNRLVQVDLPVATYRYQYDAGNNLTQIQDGNTHVTHYTYDPQDRLTGLTDAAGMTTTFTYDPKGRLIQRKDANGQTTTFTYDARDRLIRRAYPGNTDTYQYDAAGNLIQAANDAITINYSYDALNRLTGKTMVEWNKSIQYTYDGVGNRLTMTDPDGGLTTYTYDALSQLSSITNPGGQTTAFGYDTGGRLTQRTNANGTRTEYVYDVADRLLSVFHYQSDNSIICGFTYTYDEAGNRLSMLESGVGLHQYSYDESDRLISISYPDGAIEQFSYDGAGNIIQRQRDQQATTFTYDDADRLLNAGAATFLFDGNGNMTQKTTPEGVTQFIYDGLNRLVQVNTYNGDELLFVYDPFGNRLIKSINSTDRKYVLDGRNILLELDATDATKIRYTATLDYDDWLLREENGAVATFHQDGLGSISSITGGNEELQAGYTYYAFGEIKSQLGNSNNELTFTGREWDEETGLYYYRSRYYAPGDQRFLSKDKFAGWLGRPLSLNKFAYVEGNPVNRIDPRGTFSKTLRNLFKRAKKHGEKAFNFVKDTKEEVGDQIAPTTQEYSDGWNNFNEDITNTEKLNRFINSQQPYRTAVGNCAPEALKRGGNFLFSSVFSIITQKDLPFDLLPEKENCAGDGSGNQDGPQPTSDAQSSITSVVGAVDPNEIAAPPGIGANRWVSKDADLTYTIYYENDPDSSDVAAQLVRIEQVLDPKLNPSSFHLGAYGFGPFEFTIPEGRSHHQDFLEVSDSVGVNVAMEAGINYGQGQLFWDFQSIDTLTGEFTQDVFAGFLPVNDTITRKGEGFVTYSIRPRNDLETNDTIYAQAANVFDFNDPVLTNIEFNTIDADAPFSQVLPVKNAPSDNRLLVEWNGTDIGAGVAAYSVFVSTNGGPFLKWLENTQATSGLYPAAIDSTYCFISVATDSVHNVQPFPNLCRTAITFETSLSEACPNEAIQFFDQDPVPSGTYRAATALFSKGKVRKESIVHFRAGDAIYLTPGFHAKSGSRFTAQIASCPDAPSSSTPASDQVIEAAALFELEQVNEQLELLIIPNPASSSVQLQFLLPTEQAITIDLFDITGRRIQRLLEKRFQSGWQQFGLQTSQLSEGMYFLSLSTPYDRVTRKLMIIK